MASYNHRMYSQTEPDPMICSALYDDFPVMPPQSSQPIQMSMEFDPNPSYAAFDSDEHHIEMDMDSPMSNTSEIDLGFRDSASVTSCSSHDYSEVPPTPSPISRAPALEKQSSIDSYTEDKYRADQELILRRWGPHDVFPNVKEWTLEEKAAELLRLSPCSKYEVCDLVNVNLMERPEDKVNMLIEVVANISVSFRWNYVKPEELFRSYTVVTNCKKEKAKKDAEGRPIPKRPMNAFMIWCQKCRTLMSHICPQLHNAIISKALGAVWKTFTKEDKQIYEHEKQKLMLFHKQEFPDYKYRPKKKPKKVTAKAINPAPKSKSKKKKEKAQPVPLKAINIADVRQSVDPTVKERLQVKMQVKIDPDFKRGMGKRATAIDIADLSGYQTSDISPNSVHYSSEKSSVFDTPENSPHEPRTPSPNHADPSSFNTFKFDPSNIRSQTENNNNALLGMDNRNIKVEPGLALLTTTNLWHTRIIKTEPDVPVATAVAAPAPQERMFCGMPILSAEYVDSVLEANNENLTSSLPNNITLMDNTMLDATFPDIIKFLSDGHTPDVEDLLQIDSSSLVMETPAGPATV